MANTTKSPEITFEQMAELMLRNAQLRAESIKEVMAERASLGDYNYMLRHLADGAVRIEFRVDVLTTVVKHGREALVDRVAHGLNQSTSYAGFAAEVSRAVQEEARALLREFREFLSPEEAVALLARLY